MFCITLYTRDISILEQSDHGAGLTQRSGSPARLGPHQAQADTAGSTPLPPLVGAWGLLLQSQPSAADNILLAPGTALAEGLPEPPLSPDPPALGGGGGGGAPSGDR